VVEAASEADVEAHVEVRAAAAEAARAVERVAEVVHTLAAEREMLEGEGAKEAGTETAAEAEVEAGS
jgi:hypothetical protein